MKVRAPFSEAASQKPPVMGTQDPSRTVSLALSTEVKMSDPKSPIVSSHFTARPSSSPGYRVKVLCT